jgi:hypothetical protein
VQRCQNPKQQMNFIKFLWHILALALISYNSLTLQPDKNLPAYTRSLTTRWQHMHIVRFGVSQQHYTGSVSMCIIYSFILNQGHYTEQRRICSNY